MQKIRVGVVGVGALGQHHARNYSELPGCELVGVADIDPKAATRIASSYRCQAFFDYKLLFERVDAVSIVVPTTLHYPLATEFLDHGIHIFVEKPITAEIHEARDLINRAKAADRVLQVGHIERFNAAVEHLNEVLTHPLFIECHRLGPYDPRVRDVGVVLDLMIHDIDIVLNIVKAPLVSVDAVGVPIISRREDLANARLRFENGCIANLTVSRVSPNKLRKIRIFQPEAYLSIDYQDQTLEIYEREEIENAAPNEPQAQIVRRKIRLKKEEPLKVELQHFLDCVRNGHEPRVTGEHGHDALAVAVTITEQIQQNLGRIKDFPAS